MTAGQAAGGKIEERYMDNQRDYAEEVSNQADMVREGQQEADEEYRALIDSGVRTREAVDRIAELVGGNALLELLDHGRNS